MSLIRASLFVSLSLPSNKLFSDAADPFSHEGASTCTYLFITSVGKQKVQTIKFAKIPQQEVMQPHTTSSFHETGFEGALKHQSFMLFNLTGKIYAEELWEYRREGLSRWAIHTLCCVKRFCQGSPLALMVLIGRISGWVQLVKGVRFGSWLQYAVAAFYSWQGPIDLIKHWPSVHLVAVCSHVKVARASLTDGTRSSASERHWEHSCYFSSLEVAQASGHEKGGRTS